MTKRWIALNNEVKILKDGKYQFEKDVEATRSYFLDNINTRTRWSEDFEEKMEYLYENDYYDEKVFSKYSFNQIKKLSKLVYGEKFRFPSFMSAYKFYNNYALLSNDKQVVLERYEDRVVANAILLGDGDYEKAVSLATRMIKQRIQPATPTFLNAARSRSGELVSCFLVDTPDSTEGIEYMKEAVAQLSRIGGGVGVNLSKIRASGETIKEIEGSASGPMGVARMVESTVAFYDQLGQRKGSAVVNISGHHPDSGTLLESKKVNADDTIRLKTLSLAIIVTSKMIEKLKAGEPFYQFYPHSVYKEYGVHIDEIDMDEWYDKLVANPNVRKQLVQSDEFFNLIAITQQQSGYPYLIFIDNANRQNPLKELGRIIMSNLCTEIFQNHKKSTIRPRHLQSDWGEDVSCNLISLNIRNVMVDNDLRGSTRGAMDAVSFVAKSTSIDQVPTVKKGNDNKHAVGVGAMNLHGYLAENEIMYTSREAKDFANVFFAAMNFYSIERSMEIAIEEGFIFDGFEKSDYANGRYFKKYLKYDFLPVTDKVKELFVDMKLPTKEDWAELAEKVAKNGLAHAYRLAIAPTGNISYVQSATASVAPIMEQIETRKYGDSTTQYPMPYMNNENMFFYQSAYQMSTYKYLDLIAVIQQHIDQGISTTLFVDSTATSEQLVSYYAYAHDKGLKSLYYTRTKLLQIDECLSCAV